MTGTAAASTPKRGGATTIGSVINVIVTGACATRAPAITATTPTATTATTNARGTAAGAAAGALSPLQTTRLRGPAGAGTNGYGRRTSSGRGPRCATWTLGEMLCVTAATAVTRKGRAQGPMRHVASAAWQKKWRRQLQLPLLQQRPPLAMPPTLHTSPQVQRVCRRQRWSLKLLCHLAVQHPCHLTLQSCLLPLLSRREGRRDGVPPLVRSYQAAAGAPRSQSDTATTATTAIATAAGAAPAAHAAGHGARSVRTARSGCGIRTAANVPHATVVVNTAGSVHGRSSQGLAACRWQWMVGCPMETGPRPPMTRCPLAKQGAGTVRVSPQLQVHTHSR